jgi:hypothetical protein
LPCRRWPRLEPTGRLQGTEPLGGGVRLSLRPPARRSSQRGDHVGANPVDRDKPGTRLHLVCDGGGLPLTAVVTAANLNDTTMFQAVVADIPPIRTPAGRRRSRPAKVHADKGYDSEPTGPGCAGVGSSRGSLGGRSSPQPGLGATAGRSSVPCRG